jgi:hypothetical protein
MVRIASLLSFHRDGETIRVKVTEAAAPAAAVAAAGGPKGNRDLIKDLVLIVKLEAIGMRVKG